MAIAGAFAFPLAIVGVTDASAIPRRHGAATPPFVPPCDVPEAGAGQPLCV